MDSRRLLVGAPEDSQQAVKAGAAYTFWFDGNSWTQQQKLTTNDPSYKQQLGMSVSVCGDTAVAGASYDRRNTGAAYVFEAQ